MIRLLLVLGPVVAIIGSVGLFLFDSAIVGVFEVLTWRIADPPNPLPALAQLQWAVLSAAALVVGLVISCFATTMQDNERTLSQTGRLWFAGAGVSLIVGSITLAWVIIGAHGSFKIIASAATSPKPESVQAMIQSTESTMMMGGGMLILAAALLLAGGTVGFRARSSETTDGPSTISRLIAIGSVLVGLVLLLSLIALWSCASAIATMMTETAVKPAELAHQLIRILNQSLCLFGGFAVLGILQLLVSVIAPSARVDERLESEM